MKKHKDQKRHFSSEKLGESIPQTEPNAPDFWEIWHSLSGYLLPLCRKWLEGSSIEPEEALSGAMMEAFEGYTNRQHSIQNLRAWLTRVTHNHCMDLHRAGRRWAGGDSIQDQVGREHPSLGRVESPEDTLVRGELYASMRTAMDQLPERLRAPMILRSLQGMAYRDIARHLNISIENVRKRVQHARELLQQNLQGVGRGAASPHGQEARSLAPAERQLADTALRRPSPELPDDLGYPFPVEWADAAGNRYLRYVYLAHRPGRTAQKIQTLEQYVAKFSSGWKKRWELALLRLQVGELDGALVELNWISEKQPWYFQAKVLLARLERWQGNKASAASLYRSAGTSVRLESTRFHLKGLAEWSDGNFDMAEQALSSAHSAAPEHWTHLRALARLYRHIGNYPKLHSVCGALVRQVPGNEVALAEMIAACIAVDDATEAMAWMNQLGDSLPTTLPLLIQVMEWQGRLAGDSLAVERVKALRRQYKGLVRGTPLEKYPLLGSNEVERGNWTLPNDWQHWPRGITANLANLYHRKGMGKEAWQVADFMFRQHADSAEGAKLWLQMAIWEPAAKPHLSEIESLANRFPVFWEVQLLAGWALAVQGAGHTVANRLYSVGLELQPLMPRAWCWAGQAALATGDISSATRLFKKGWNAHQRLQSPIFGSWIALYLGFLEYRKPKWFQVVQSQQSIMKKWDPALAYFFNAHAAWGLGQYALAKQEWRNATKASLGYPLLYFPPGSLPFWPVETIE